MDSDTPGYVKAGIANRLNALERRMDAVCAKIPSASDNQLVIIDALARSLQREARTEALARGMRVDPYIGLPTDFEDGI